MVEKYIVVITEINGEQHQQYFTDLMSMWEYATERKKVFSTEKIELLTKQILYRKG